jgi:hypothetical protein
MLKLHYRPVAISRKPISRWVLVMLVSAILAYAAWPRIRIAIFNYKLTVQHEMLWRRYTGIKIPAHGVALTDDPMILNSMRAASGFRPSSLEGWDYGEYIGDVSVQQVRGNHGLIYLGPGYNSVGILGVLLIESDVYIGDTADRRLVHIYCAWCETRDQLFSKLRRSRIRIFLKKSDIVTIRDVIPGADGSVRMALIVNQVNHSMIAHILCDEVLWSGDGDGRVGDNGILDWYTYDAKMNHDIKRVH